MPPWPPCLHLEEVPGLEKEGNSPMQSGKNPLIFKLGRHGGGEPVLSPSQSDSDKEGKQEIMILIETPGKDRGDIAPQHNYPHWIVARTQPDIRFGSSCAAALRLKHSHGI